MNYGMDYQGGDSGGGYTNNNFGGGSPQASQTQRPRRSYDEQTLTPVTVQMAMNAHPDPAGGDGSLLLADGRKIHSVVLVAAVRSVDPQTTNIVYQLEDGTGLIDVKQWLDDNDCQAIQETRQSTLKEHIYLKVIGQIKDYEGNKMIVANSVRPLSTANELTHHMLQVVYSAESYKRQSSIVTLPPTVHSGVGFGSSMPIAQATGGGNSLRDQVLDFIKTQDDGGESGVNIHNCFNTMASQPEGAIRKAIEELAEEGFIYSTVDEDHYKHAS